MDLLNQIKELEKKSKQSEIYKERYEELLEKIKETITELNKLITGYTGVRTGTTDKHQKVKPTEKHHKIAERLHLKLKTEDGKEINKDDIINELKQEESSTNHPNIITIQDLLEQKEGIQYRKGKYNKKIYFYHGKQGDDEDKKRLLEIMPKKIKMGI